MVKKAAMLWQMFCLAIIAAGLGVSGYIKKSAPKAKKRDRSKLPRLEAALGRALSDEATRGDAAVALAIGPGPVEPAAFAHGISPHPAHPSAAPSGPASRPGGSRSPGSGARRRSPRR